jgi:hypothetical protein
MSFPTLRSKSEAVFKEPVYELAQVTPFWGPQSQKEIAVLKISNFRISY